MREKWLANLLRDGFFTDNGYYRFQNRNLVNVAGTSLVLRKKRYREQIKNHPVKKNNFAWLFLKYVAEHMSSSEPEVTFIDGSLYEHNTQDPLIKLLGSDHFNFSLETGNLIGYVKKGDYALKISSRFGDAFLKHIIADADGFLQVEGAGGANQDTHGYEWLLYYLWKIKLQKAFRLGVPKSYESRRDQLSKVRGQIEPVSFFESKLTAKYDCRYREHSYDNPATRLIATTFNHLAEYSFLNDLPPARNAFTTASLGKSAPLSSLLDTPHFANPYYAAYNDVIDLSKQLLKKNLSSFGDAKDEDAFLFDVSMLFEYYIKKLLLRAGFLLRGKAESTSRIPRGLDNGALRKLEPDLLWETEKGAYVFDVKYKNFNFRDGVKREDLFQLYTYASQYGNEYDLQGFGLVYPLSSDKYNKGKTIIEQSTFLMGKRTRFFVIFLPVPEYDINAGEQQFHQKMRDAANQMVQNLKRVTHA